MTDTSAKYAIIMCGAHRLLALKLDLHVPAPNVLAIGNDCELVTKQRTVPAVRHLVLGDQIRITRIRPEHDNQAIPMCEEYNRVNWPEAAPPRIQAFALTANLVLPAERIVRLVFMKAVGEGTPRAHTRFFDPFSMKERVLPKRPTELPVTSCGIIRLTFVKIPKETRMQRLSRCYVPADYEQGPLKWDTVTVDTFEPMLHTRLTEEELAGFNHVLKGTPTKTSDMNTRRELEAATIAMIRSGLDRDWRLEHTVIHPTVSEYGKSNRTALVKPHFEAGGTLIYASTMENLVARRKSTFGGAYAS